MSFSTKIIDSIFFLIIIQIWFSQNIFPQTSILKWKDGKSSCVTITYDDGSKNQFRIAMPIMDKYKLPGTFFINTGYFSGSKYFPYFIGRPVMDILKETATTPANQSNIFERTSMIRYLFDIQKVPEISSFNVNLIGNNLERKRFEEVFKTVNEICDILRESNKVFKAEPVRINTDEFGSTWEEMKKYAENGHEIACHTISHPNLSNFNEENMMYELLKCKEDIEDHLGYKHTLSVECPYGNHDKRVLDFTAQYFPFMRNRCPEEYIDEILRSDSRMPGKTEKEYIQWQRGPLSKTPYSLMTSWIDTSIHYNVWLVLVIHGVEGIGWEPQTTETVQNYFAYIKNKEQNVWVATFQDGYKYIHERMNSKLSESKEGGAITVKLTNDLDKKIYDLPVTLKSTVSKEWKEVKVQQGKSVMIVNTASDKNDRYVIYDAMPDGIPVKLSKAK